MSGKHHHKKHHDYDDHDHHNRDDHHHRHDHSERHPTATVPEAIVVPERNGPYCIRGKVSIVTPDGKAIETADGEIRLCRCGQSPNKPFCDGTHERTGFQSDLDAELTTQITEGYKDVGGEQDVREGEIKGFQIDGKPVLLSRVEGQLYAIGGACSHKQVLLEGGKLEGLTVHCPRHPGAFDIRTGNAIRPPAVTAVPTYDVKVERGRILVARHPRCFRQ
ncbi:MAG: CDGSH iron-sulfur domain-containing protein [Chloroflexi bacterium]|nr:CDGSH iron-sulfur domain-containing protein [Chloroflexota bacterium]